MLVGLGGNKLPILLRAIVTFLREASGRPLGAQPERKPRGWPQQPGGHGPTRGKHLVSGLASTGKPLTSVKNSTLFVLNTSKTENLAQTSLTHWFLRKKIEITKYHYLNKRLNLSEVR